MAGLSYPELTSYSLDTLSAWLVTSHLARICSPHWAWCMQKKVGYSRITSVYLLLTFMLPKAEGCGTGLQLSAKDVVLGRPDMIQSL